MSFIEEFYELEEAVKEFDAQDVDLTTLTDHELNRVETSRLPLYRLHDKAYQERLRRIEIRNEERRAEQERIKARYGYRFPEKDEWNAIDIYRAEEYEKGIIEAAFYFDEANAMDVIHQMIPTIADEEIDEYRKEEVTPIT